MKEFAITTYYDSDDSQVESLLEDIEENILSVSADGAYDTGRVYQVIAKSSNEDVVVAIPPRKNALLSKNHISSPSKRAQCLAEICLTLPGFTGQLG